ncbi:Alpha-ketoglutarate-dependent dioxygenase alkB 6 [Mactra antiquata]
MVPEELPEWLKVYTKKISSMGIFDEKEANHVLVNEYLPGQGIMPHEDGPLFYPTVSTISLGSHTVLDFYSPLQDSTKEDGDLVSSSSSYESRYMCSVLLQPRSLILVRDDMYKVNLHGIAERKEDLVTDKIVNLDKCDDVSVGQTLTRSTRVSLTIRVMPKILKAKLLLGRKR